MAASCLLCIIDPACAHEKKRFHQFDVVRTGQYITFDWFIFVVDVIRYCGCSQLCHLYIEVCECRRVYIKKMSGPHPHDQTGSMELVSCTK